MLPADTPKLPKWPFLLGDAVLLGLAWLIASQSRSPFAGTPFLAMVGCIMVGAVLAVVPFLADYARKQDEALDERQRSLDALSRTVAASAEQIGIAASGLHEIAALAQRNLKAAEQLPEKLQDKIAGFKNQLASTREAEREELQKELARLRTSESERLQSAADQLARTAVELARIEASTQKILAACAELAERTRLELLRPARPETSEPADPAPAEQASPEPIETLPVAASVPVEPPASPPKRTRKPRVTSTVVSAEPLPAAADSAPSEIVAATPPAEAPPPVVAADPVVAPVTTVAAPPTEPDPNVSAASPSVDLPAAVMAVVEEVIPAPPALVAPATAEEPVNADAAAVSPAPVDTSAALPKAEEPAKPERKRAPRKPKVVPPPAENPVAETPPAETISALPEEPTLGLVETAPASPPPEATENPAPAERVVSSDGATRLLVTAYIGIGNRLFIRGEGPGLSWDKGLPLQFVSIGKWRWETSDAIVPVQFKLYKNDTLECSALGARTIDPGQQQEVTATF
jgi:hypothetical protein